MNDMQQVEALTALSHQMMTQYHERRNLEWRMHVLIWTLLVVGVYFVVTIGISVKPWWLWIVLLPGVLVVHIIWTLKMQLGEIRDQDQSIRYRKAAEGVIRTGLLSLPPESDEEQSRMPPWLHKWLNFYWLWNIVIVGTTFLMIMAIMMVVLAGHSGEREATMQPLKELEHRLETLEQEGRVTALGLKQIRADLEVLRQSSSARVKSQPSNLQ